MVGRYRFLLTPRWLGLAALAVVLIATCVFLGSWQHDRYEDRAATNDRIQRSQASDDPADVGEVFGPDDPPRENEVWTKVRAEGRYDESGQVLIRNRSVDGRAGYEVVTPLILDDGTALLVDRGWIPFSDEGATVLPDVPPAPAGTVVVEGTVHASEAARGGVDEVEGVNQARSINVEQIADELPYRVLPGFITDVNPTDGLTPIPVVEERSWQNFAYAYQWWLFAAMIPVGLFALARREASPRPADRTSALADRLASDGAKPVRETSGTSADPAA